MIFDLACILKSRVFLFLLSLLAGVCMTILEKRLEFFHAR